MNLMSADMIGLKYYSNRQQSVAPVVHTSLKKPVKLHDQVDRMSDKNKKN